MTALNENFLDWAANAAYPFDDQSSRTDSDGQRLPDSLLTSVKLWTFGYEAYQRAYVGAVFVGPAVVSVTLLGTDGDFHVAPSAAALPLATATIRRPVTPGRMYRVTPARAGVDGWVAFGPGLDDLSLPYRIDFDQYTQSLLLPACLTSHKGTFVSSIGKLGAAQALHGAVQLRAGPDLEIIQAERLIDGEIRNAIVIRMQAGLPRDRMKEYLGRCGGASEGNTCYRQPIFFINDVQPDCNGNIELEVTAAAMRTMMNDAGIVLQTEESLAELCAARGTIFTQPTRLAVPYLEHFNSDLPVTATRVGDFDQRINQFLQDACQFRPAAELRTVATLDISSIGRVIEVDLYLRGETYQNGYIVFGWLSPTSFWFAGLERLSVGDGDANRLVIGHVAGSQRVIDASLPLVLVDEQVYYHMELALSRVAGNTVRVELEVFGLGTLSFTTSLIVDGRVGLGTEESISYFDNFAIDYVDATPEPGPCEDEYGYVLPFIDGPVSVNVNEAAISPIELIMLHAQGDVLWEIISGPAVGLADIEGGASHSAPAGTPVTLTYESDVESLGSSDEIQIRATDSLGRIDTLTISISIADLPPFLLLAGFHSGPTRVEMVFEESVDIGSWTGLGLAVYNGGAILPLGSITQPSAAVIRVNVTGPNATRIVYDASAAGNAITASDNGDPTTSFDVLLPYTYSP